MRNLVASGRFMSPPFSSSNTFIIVLSLDYFVELGSVAEEIFRLATRPVLTVGPGVSDTAPTEIKLERILYPTDFSKESVAALDFAVSLTEEYQANLLMLHVTQKIADLIVLGVRSRQGLSARILPHLPGPTAFAVVAEARCPVLTDAVGGFALRNEP